MQLKGLPGAVTQVVVRRSGNSLAPITIALMGPKRARIEMDVTADEARALSAFLNQAAGEW